MFGWTESEALGASLTMLMPERYRDAHRAGVARVSDGGEEHVLGGPPSELVGLRADGSEFPIELTLGRWEQDGVPCFTGVVRDVTERRRAQRVLTTQHRVAAALAGASDLEEGVVLALAAIGEGMGWRAGHLWMADDAAGVLSCRGTWHVSDDAREFREESRAMTFARGDGLPGRVWSSGRSLWLEDVSADPLFLRADIATRAGLTAAVGVPVVSAGATRGVVEVFAAGAQRPDAALQEALEAVGNQLGQFLLRREAEAEIAARDRLQRQAAELNDEVVQGLALAHYHLQQAEHEQAAASVAATLAAAKAIVDGLLAGADVEPGQLRRSSAARLRIDTD